MWAAYFPEDTLDEAGEAVYEALFEIKAAEDVQQLRRILSPDSEYIKRIKAAMARGTKEYNEYNEKNLANKLEKEYAARLENNSFCIAEISGITEEELSECSEYIVNINSSENSGKVSAKFATEDFLKLADNGKALTVKSNIGVIELSVQAVKNIASSERLKAGGFVAASSAVYINITALKPGETYGLTKAQTEAIGDKKVFDLTVTNARGAVIALENAPVTVSVPYTLVEGEEIGSIKVWYINNAGEAEYVGADSYEYDEGENLWVTFTTTHFSAYVVAKAVTTTVRHAGSAPRKVSLAKKTSLNKNELLENALFSDVLSKHWAYEYIKFASEKNLLKAKDGAFEPEKALSGTDLEAAFEALGAKKPNLEPGSKELTKEEFAKALAAYAENEGEKISGGAAEWAVEKGILETSSNGKLNKNAAISRAEAAKGLYVLAGGR